MRTSTLKVVATLALALSLMFLAISVLPQGTAQADRDGGYLNKGVISTLSTGVSYTTTGNTSLSTLNVFDYGAVQIHVQSAVTGTQVLTVIPQFSSQPTPLNCSAVTSWFTATLPLVFATSNITPTTSFVNESFTVTGSDVVAREIPTQGRCFRLKLDFSAAGQVYTPTVYVRPVNRY